MVNELIYTSAEKGLLPRTQGFCTVAMTRGMGPYLIEQLEVLSGYRSHFPAHDPRAAENPVNYFHYRFAIGQKPTSVLSRVGFAGFDYTGRSNKLAHHLLLESNNLPVAGPAHVASQPGLFVTNWTGESRWLEPRAIPTTPRGAVYATTWESVTGDAGWAGVLAEHTLAALAGSGAPAVILFPEGFDSANMLRLLDEAMALIPPEQRWEVTFSTYLTDLPTGTTCLWRCMFPDSPEWEKVRRARGLLCIDLGNTFMAPAQGGDLVAAARGGIDPYSQYCNPRDAAVPLEPAGAMTVNDAKPRNSIGMPTAEFSDGVPEEYELRGDGHSQGHFRQNAGAKSTSLERDAASGRLGRAFRLTGAVVASIFVVIAVIAIVITMRKPLPPLKPNAEVTIAPALPTTERATRTAQQIAEELCAHIRKHARVGDRIDLGMGKIEGQGIAEIRWKQDIEETVLDGEKRDHQVSTNPIPIGDAGKSLRFWVTVVLETSSQEGKAFVDVRVADVFRFTDDAPLQQKMTLKSGTSFTRDASKWVTGGNPIKWSWKANEVQVGNGPKITYAPEKKASQEDYVLSLDVANAAGVHVSREVFIITVEPAKHTAVETTNRPPATTQSANKPKPTTVPIAGAMVAPQQIRMLWEIKKSIGELSDQEELANYCKKDDRPAMAARFHFIADPALEKQLRSSFYVEALREPEIGFEIGLGDGNVTKTALIKISTDLLGDGPKASMIRIPNDIKLDLLSLVDIGEIELIAAGRTLAIFRFFHVKDLENDKLKIEQQLKQAVALKTGRLAEASENLEKAAKEEESLKTSHINSQADIANSNKSAKQKEEQVTALNRAFDNEDKAALNKIEELKKEKTLRTEELRKANEALKRMNEKKEN